jgi:hypothetical protein
MVEHLNPHPEGKAWTALCPGCIEELRRQQEQAGQMSFDDLSSAAGRQHSARNTVQPGLRVGGYLSIQQRFEEWLETNAGRIVYREFIRRARALVLTGWRHYSHKAIIETIRYDVNVRIGPNDGGFKINDHYSSRIVRRAMAQYPELDGFFEVRELRA